MIADIRTLSKQCHACAKDRLKARSHQAPLKLSQPTKPLEFIAIDIQGPLTRSTSGHRYISVITDCFSKLTQAIPVCSIRVLPVANALIQNRIVVYGPPATILFDNGTQFTSKIFQFVCTELKMKSATRATYHPQTNGQCERFNRTFLAGLRSFVSEHPRYWSEYTELLPFAYNTQTHPSTGLTPIDLFLSNPPQVNDYETGAVP